MNAKKVIVLLALSTIVEGAMWAAAARGLYQPIILSVGALFAAIDQQ